MSNEKQYPTSNVHDREVEELKSWLNFLNFTYFFLRQRGVNIVRHLHFGLFYLQILIL